MSEIQSSLFAESDAENHSTPIPGWPSESDWTVRLADHFASDSWNGLTDFVAGQRQDQNVFPPVEDVFTAFRLTSFADTKVVILGQDPYHGAGQAHGLSFSVLVEALQQPGVRFPPSLRNILKELNADLGLEFEDNPSDLTTWAKQGVFLLNTVLTVNEGAANSHKKKGWETFTDCVIQQFDDHPDSVVFILWGKPAEKKTKLIADRHAIITSAHPSPLSASRGFFGSKPFSKANDFLVQFGREPIDWHLS